MVLSAECWGFGSTQHAQSVVANFEECLAKRGDKLQARAGAPLSNGYRPEIDISEEHDEAKASYNHSPPMIELTYVLRPR